MFREEVILCLLFTSRFLSQKKQKPDLFMLADKFLFWPKLQTLICLERERVSICHCKQEPPALYGAAFAVRTHPIPAASPGCTVR